MKNFLVFLLGILINILYMYVVLTIFIVGITACLWVPMFFEFRGAFIIIGIIITILTSVVIIFVDYKFESY